MKLLYLKGLIYVVSICAGVQMAVEFIKTRSKRKQNENKEES